MSLEQTYDIFKSKIGCIKCSEGELQNIKSRYASKINSKRRFDCISTIAELLRILEKRNCLSPNNMEVLMEIAVELGATSSISNLPLCSNTSTTNIINNNVNRFEAPPEEYFSVIPQILSDPKKRSYQLIATEIGQKWQDFARNLGVSEGYIDNLSTAHNTISLRVYEILRFHEQNCDKRVWRTTLLDALSHARRNDLRRQIQHIFDTS